MAGVFAQHVWPNRDIPCCFEVRRPSLTDIVSDATKALFSIIPNLFFQGKDSRLSHSRLYVVQEQRSF